VGEDGSNYGLLGAIKCVRVHKYCQLARGHRSMMGRRYSRTARSQETGLIANRKTENCETATGNKLRNNHQWGLSYIYDRWSWSCGGWVDWSNGDNMALTGAIKTRMDRIDAPAIRDRGISEKLQLPSSSDHYFIKRADCIAKRCHCPNAAWLAPGQMAMAPDWFLAPIDGHLCLPHITFLPLDNFGLGS